MRKARLVSFTFVVAALWGGTALAQAAPDADLFVTKSAPATAAAGSDVPYDVSVTNLGPDNADSVTLVDSLPPGMTFVSVSQTSGVTFVCSSPPVGSGGAITCTAITLAPATSATFHIVAHIPPAATPGTVFTNSVSVSTTTIDPNSENDTAVAGTLVPGPASDVSVTKAGPTGATAGTDVTYSISLVSAGPDPATSVTLTDPLPGTETFVSFVQNNGPAFNCPPLTVGSGGTVTCTLASFPAGTGASFTLVAHIPNGTGSGTVYNNSATVSAAEDTNSENDVGLTSLIVSSADLAITKTGPPTVTAGTNISWTITASNGGPDTAQNVRIHDALPVGTVFVSLSQSSGPLVSCATPAPGTNGAVDCGLPTLSSGTSVVLVLTAGVSSSVANGTTLANTATMDSDTGDPSAANNTSTSTSTVSAQADLSVTKTGPAALSPGQNATFTITITNNGPSDAQTVALTDAVPANATFVSETQSGGPAFVCANPAVGGTGTINCTAGSLLAGATATFTVVVKVDASASGTISNTASVSTTTTDPNAGDNTATATAPLTSSADLAVTKTGPTGVTAGQTATFTIVATNNGPSDAPTVSLSDPVPANSTFASMSQNSGPVFTCTTPAAGGTGTVTCTIATLPAAASATFTLVLNTPNGASGTLSNTVTITSATADPNPANNSATTTTNVAASSADLAITKTATAPGVSAGADVTYTIVATNNGPSPAQNVSLSDALPANTTFVSMTQSAGPAFTCTTPAAGGTGTVTCTIAALASGGSATFTLVLNTSATAAGTISNTTTITSATGDPNAANNTSTAAVTVAAALADLSIAKSASAGNVIPGTNVIYTIVVTNNGPATATGVTVTDVLPAAMTFVSATTTQGSCTGTTTVTCNVGSILNGANATITITATAGTTLTSTANTATVTSTSTDPDPANNSSTTNVVIAEAIPTLSPGSLLFLVLFLGAAGVFVMRSS